MINSQKSKIKKVSLINKSDIIVFLLVKNILIYAFYETLISRSNFNLISFLLPLKIDATLMFIK